MSVPVGGDGSEVEDGRRGCNCVIAIGSADNASGVGGNVGTVLKT